MPFHILSKNDSPGVVNIGDSPKLDEWGSPAVELCNPLPAFRGEAVFCQSSWFPCATTADKMRLAGRRVERLATLRLFSHRWSTDAVQSGSVARMAVISFLSPPLFFSSCFYSRREGPVLHFTITPLHSSTFAWVCCEVEGALIVVE